MEQELKGQEKELTDDINNLNKKVCLEEFFSFLFLRFMLMIIYPVGKIPREAVQRRSKPAS